MCNTPLDRDLAGEYNTSGRRAWQWNDGEPFTADHLGPEPMTFNSQRDLARACDAQGVSIGRLS